jgi:hypothetical protein
MAQAGFTPISLYYSTTAAATPSAGNLVAGELALNTVDEKLYFKNSAGTVKLLASNATSAPVLSFSAGTTGFTPSTATTGAVTLAGTLGTANGGTNLTSFTSGGVVYASSTSALATGSALTFDGTRLGVGVSSAGFPIDVASISGETLRLRGTVSTGVSQVLFTSDTAGTNYSYLSSASGYLAFGMGSSTEGMRLTSTGLGIGTSSIPSGFKLYASGGSMLLDNNTAFRQKDSAGNNTLIFALSSGNNLEFGSSQHTGGMAIVTGNSNITFTTNSAERMRLDSSGNLLVGTTSNANSDKLVVNGQVYQFQTVNGSSASPVTNGGYIFGPNSSTIYGGIRFINQILSNNSIEVAVYTTSTAGSAAEVARFSNTGGFSVGTTANPGAGAIYATGNITAYYSDARLKTVSGKIENALDKVAQLSGVYYTNNSVAKSFGYDSDEVQVGVLAQDVEAVLPQIVKAAPFDLDENNNSKSGENYKTVQYERLVPLLIEAVKELRAEVKALKGE